LPCAAISDSQIGDACDGAARNGNGTGILRGNRAKAKICARASGCGCTRSANINWNRQRCWETCSAGGNDLT
jgi:hypothetical protein